MSGSAGHRICTMTLASVYPLYLAKVEKKGRTKDELDVVIRWLTGYDQSELDRHLAVGSTFEDFFAGARLHPNAALITGVVCGVRVEAIEDPLMQRIRFLDQLVDELAKGLAWRRCCAADGLRADVSARASAAEGGVLERRDRVAAASTSVRTRVPSGVGGRMEPDHEGPA